jgi:predicted SprT family Zn-dependent metalloprotease
MPTLSFYDDHLEDVAWYMPIDGMGLPHRINVNIRRMKDGRHFMETLAHELCHLAMTHDGTQNKEDHHDELFREVMMDTYGVPVTETGHHLTNNGEFDLFMDCNEDLGLERYTWSPPK